MSAQKVTERTWASQVDVKTDTPGVYRRNGRYRVLTRPDGKRKVMHCFDTYEEAVAFKEGLPTREPLLERYFGAMRQDPCAYCGAPAEVIDHIVPVASGGPNDWANYTAACSACNARKGKKPLLVFLAREFGCWEWRAGDSSKPPAATQ